MDHNYAIENHTAERYLLQDLNEDERDAYEEHFFSCSTCAEEVRTASEFLESAKQVVQDEVTAHIYGRHVARHPNWGNWLNWRSIMHPLPAMACALLVLVTGFAVYQNQTAVTRSGQTASAVFPTQGMTTAQLVNASATVLSASRSEESIKSVNIARGDFFSLQFDVPPTASDLYQSYKADIVDGSNATRISYKISKEEARDPVKVLVAGGSLGSGEYWVVIQGVNSKGPESGVKGELARLPFQLNVQD